MATLSFPTTFADGATLEASQLNNNNAAVAAVVNGALDTNNLHPSAMVSAGQLATPYEHITLRLFYNGGALPAATTLLDYCVIPDIDTITGGAWYAEELYWMCTDTGTGASKLDLVLGHFAVGAWVADSTIASGFSLSKQTGAADDLISCGYVYIGTSLARGASVPNILRLQVHTQGAGATSTAGSYIQVLVKCRRLISGV